MAIAMPVMSSGIARIALAGRRHHEQPVLRPATRPTAPPHRTLGLSRASSRSEARAEQLSWLSRGPLYNFLALHLLGLPGCPMLQHGVENGQELVHTRCQGDFFD